MSLWRLKWLIALLTVAAGLLSLISPLTVFAKADMAHVLLAKVYQANIDVTQYLVSEKLDGVRALWDGKVLRTRKGNVIHAPQWFTKDFPPIALDGELWIARNQFDVVSGIVRTKVPVDALWRKVSYQIFELPNAIGDFETRYQAMLNVNKASSNPYLKVVAQYRVKNHAALNQHLQSIVDQGGEGLMLHRADALFVAGRNKALLKLKPSFDAEAVVVGYLEGRGKYQGLMGALLLETPAGIRFKLGSGFTDKERANPPKIGSLITYTYKSKTPSGKPRFASYLRVRNE